MSNKTFQEMLEDARYEVSISIYPNNIPYQIFKPSCSGAHCWEVYRFPNTDDEFEVDTGCDSLDDAVKSLERDLDSMVMSDDEWKRYSDAVDLVCINCGYTTEEACEKCLVRASVDRISEMREWRNK